MLHSPKCFLRKKTIQHATIINVRLAGQEYPIMFQQQRESYASSLTIDTHQLSGIKIDFAD